MKVHSITRRLTIFVLLTELLLAACTTGAALLYEHNHALRSFNIMLHGRADSVFGAVQDAEDNADDVKLDLGALHVPDSDLYEVVEDTGKQLGRSPNWSGASAASVPADKESWKLVLDRHHYRGVTLHGIRGIDLDEPGGGSHHRITIYYASSTRPIDRALWEAARFLLLTNSLLLLATAAVIVLVLRRGMVPLKLLAGEATRVSGSSWNFHAPNEAYAVEELAPLAAALDAALQRLELSFRQQKDFVSDAAHELKTAVTIVKSSLQLLALRPRTIEEYKTGLDDCLSDCARMEDLVQKMLALARAEQIDHLLSVDEAFSTVNLCNCIEDVVRQLDPVAAVREVRTDLRIEPGASPMEAAVPWDDLFIVASNLVLNAIQHSTPGGGVQVKIVQDSAAWASVEVSDQGEGIAPEDLPLVFDRFRRGDPSRSRETGGAGLGLAIAKAIVDAYGGSIAIASAVAVGTKVTFRLPVAAPDGNWL